MLSNDTILVLVIFNATRLVKLICNESPLAKMICNDASHCSNQPLVWARLEWCWREGDVSNQGHWRPFPSPLPRTWRCGHCSLPMHELQCLWCSSSQFHMSSYTLNLSNLVKFNDLDMYPIAAPAMQRYSPNFPNSTAGKESQARSWTRSIGHHCQKDHD